MKILPFKPRVKAQSTEPRIDGMRMLLEYQLAIQRGHQAMLDSLKRDEAIERARQSALMETITLAPKSPWTKP